MEPCQLSPQQ